MFIKLPNASFFMRAVRILVLILAFLAVFFLFFNLGKFGQFIFLLSSFLFSAFLFSFYILHHGMDEEPPATKERPKVSVLIPCYNGSKTIARCLSHIKKLEYGGEMEIIVIDDASRDNSAQIAQECGANVLRQEKNTGKAAALNIGLAKCSGKIVLCVDVDTYPPPDLLEKSVPLILEEKNGAITYFINADSPKTIWQKIQDVEYFVAFGLLQSLLNNFNGIVVAQGAISLFRRGVLLKIGGYDEKNITEDFEIGLRLIDNGYCIKYLPIRVLTEVPASFEGLMRQRIRWHRGGMMNLYNYRRLISDSRLGDMGMFALPMLVIGIFFIIATFFFIASRFAITIYGFLAESYYSSIYGEWGALRADVFAMRADLMIIVLPITAIFIFFFATSMRMINAKFSLSKLFGLLSTLFLYPLIVSFFYASSLFSELAKGERKW